MGLIGKIKKENENNLENQLQKSAEFINNIDSKEKNNEEKKEPRRRRKNKTLFIERYDMKTVYIRKDINLKVKEYIDENDLTLTEFVEIALKKFFDVKE